MTECLKHINDEWDKKTKGDEGSFGNYYKASKIKGCKISVYFNDLNLCDDFEIGTKEIKKNKFNDKEIIVLETLKKLNYDWVLKYYGLGQCKNDDYYIYTEHLTIQSLVDIKKNNNGKISEEDIKQITRVLLRIVSELHKHNILHRDIKGQHIFWDKTSNSVKLIDYGVSKPFSDQSKYSAAGTPTHMAPEVKLNTGDGCIKSEIFSIGCTLVEIAGGVLTGGNPIIPDRLTSVCKNFIQHCLVFNKKARYNLEQLLNHPFINEETANNTNNNSDQTTSNSENIMNINGLTENTWSVPKNITRLSFTDFNQYIEYGDIPDSVTYLDLGDLFDLSSNNSENIPTNNICKLECGFRFNKVLNSRYYPSSVTSLVLTGYDIPIAKNSISSFILSLTLGSNFSAIESLINLPSSVFNLKFGTPLGEQYISENIKQYIPHITSLEINGQIVNVDLLN